MVINDDSLADHNEAPLEMEEKRDEHSTLAAESNLHEIFDEEVQHAPDCDLQETQLDNTSTNVNDKTALWIHKFTKRNKNWLTLVKILTVLIVYSVIGAFIFLAIEGEHEQTQMVVINKERYILLGELYQLTRNQTGLNDYRRWIFEVFKHLDRYEKQLYDSYHESNVVNNKGHKWEFWNTLFYCGTVYTTIGYGHITPSTDLGRAITIVYALIGIPIFLLLLTDSGQLLSRVLNLMWAYMHRVYLKSLRSGFIWWICKRCCKKQTPEDCERTSENGGNSVILDLDNYNDVLDLPLSVALTILITYMFIGASIYNLWEEEWSFFESFYFVFISMSTIGFGDYIPKHPMYMMATILYLVFGLALMSMCLNVMQIKLTEISRKIIASIRTKSGETIFRP
ncbi:hypothetical protein B566_EDAN007766 [Ephemera danica]|nr:hypothetical protein B566_EDAN007766 [Ephemera danica]